MTVDLAKEEFIPLRDVPDCLPRKGGKKISLSAIYRWSNGLRGVRLATYQIGGTRCTTQKSLSEFFTALSAQAGLVDQSPTVKESLVSRQAEIDRATARVESLVR
jgi:hypothetical protein